MKLIIQIFVFALLFGGCTSTKPGSGAGIRYYLPKTIVKADLTLVLKDCKNNSKGHAQLDVEPKLSWTLTPGTDGQARMLSGELLGSKRIKRQLSVSLHPSGLISGINSTNQDRTAAIISNAGKIATKILIVAASTDSNPATSKIKYNCHSDLTSNLQSINNLKKNIVRKQKKLRSGRFSGSPKEIQEEIDALAFEIAKIKSVSPMTLSFSKTIPIDDLDLSAVYSRTKGKDEDLNIDKDKNEAVIESDIDFEFKDIFDKWLEKSNVDGIQTEHEAKKSFKKNLQITWAGKKSVHEKAIISKNDKLDDFKACELSILVPSQTYIDLQITPKGKLYDKKLEIITKSIPAPQLGNSEELCLSVGFAENRTINMSFNEFGQRTSFTWSSEAKAENVTSALAGIANDVSTTMSTLEGQSELDKQLETIKQVNTQIQYNNALLCQQAAAEGATSCLTGDD